MDGASHDRLGPDKRRPINYANEIRGAEAETSRWPRNPRVTRRSCRRRVLDNIIGRFRLGIRICATAVTCRVRHISAIDQEVIIYCQTELALIAPSRSGYARQIRFEAAYTGRTPTEIASSGGGGLSVCLRRSTWGSEGVQGSACTWWL